MIDRPMEDIDAILDRFRQWLEAARDEARDLGADGLRAGHAPDEMAGDPKHRACVGLLS